MRNIRRNLMRITASRRKLTDENVRQIHEQRAAGMTLRAIAEQHGVAPSTISGILAGVSWRWVKPAEED